MKRKLRAALIHDGFLYMGGAERVVSVLWDMFPQADLFTAFLPAKARKHLEHIRPGRMTSSPFDAANISETSASLLKPFIYMWWKHLDLSSYDVVISSSHSFSAKSVRVPAPIPHISYIHSPPRYLYGHTHQVSWENNFLLRAAAVFLRKQDSRDAQGPDVLIANSRAVQQRIRTWYHRESTVIYPPVKMPERLQKHHPKYYLCISHLLRQKHIDIAVAACSAGKVPLVVAGSGPEEARLRRVAGPSVRFVGNVSDSRLDALWAGAIALLYPSEDEDFGIVPVEAMAHGIPVIAHNSGGVRETVVDGKTGVLFSELSSDSLAAAMQKSRTYTFSVAVLKKRASLYSETVFRQKVRYLIDKTIQKSGR